MKKKILQWVIDGLLALWLRVGLFEYGHVDVMPARRNKATGVVQISYRKELWEAIDASAWIECEPAYWTEFIPTGKVLP